MLLPTADPLRQRAEANIRSLVEFAARRSRVEHLGARARVVRSVGIVGAGMMGAQIAACTAACKFPVVITDVDPGVLVNLPKNLAVALNGDASTTRLDPAIRRLVQPTADPAAVARCDLVLETVTEKPAIKQRVFAELEPHFDGGATLSSNTSTLPITRLARGLTDPSRFCGLHFFSPVRERPVVEIVRGSLTSAATIATAVSHVKALGKMPLVVDDGPGFVVNRMMLPYVSEAMQLLIEGASIEAVDRAGTDFGMALGPIALLDQTGLDTALDCGWVFSGVCPDAFVASPLLVSMIKAGRFGRKSGAGFFSHEDESGRPVAPRPDPAVNSIIARWAEAPKGHTQEIITSRLFLLMLLEATRILEEGKATDPRLIDLGVIFGLGFPKARGGLIYWGDTLGAARVVEMLKPLESLGPRARPTSILLEMARENRRFYDIHP